MLRKLMWVSGLASGIAALALLAGCNTMSGMGKDIKAGGQAIEDAANSPSKKKQQ